MSQIDAGDFERHDPPDGLWERISASIAAETATTPPGSGSVVEYSINADDILITVDEAWAEFARENDAPGLSDLDPTRTLWSYFNGEEVRDLWQLLIEQVRAKQAQACVPLRCDAPNMRRWLEMTITPAANGVVHFRSLLLFEQPRADISLLGLNTEGDSDAPTVSVCSWCGRGHHHAHWLEIEELLRELRLLENPSPSIAYGVCPTCRDLMSADLLVHDTSHDSPN